jgi:3D-(3,5/4)-trihydroxycyclohexane-1,2-dione acylhydrolase (decyclizing)
VPVEFLADREWHLRRPLPERGPLERAVAAIRGARAPFVVAGGGVLYSGAEDELRHLVEATGIPAATTQAGGGSLRWDHPQYLGGVGATGSTAANRVAAEADVVIGVGTRYSDFTTASRSAFQNPGVRFVNVNVAPFDAAKHGTALPLVADAREALRALRGGLEGFHVSDELAERMRREKAAWDQVVDQALAPSGRPVPGQAEIIGAVHAAVGPRDVLVQAAGSLPGDLHKLWRVRDPLGYHVEYAFSCMGYEIAGGLGVKRGLEALGDDRDVIVMVGDGSYLMLSSELASAAAEGLKLVVVLIQNHGYASIGNLSEQVGSQRFGTRYAPVDLATNARGYGVDVVEVDTGPSAAEEVKAAVARARASTRTTVIHLETDPLLTAPDGEGWWDVPVAEVSELETAREARRTYEEERRRQRPLVG